MVAVASPPDFAMSAREVVALGRIPFERRFGGTSAADEAAVEEAMRATDTAHFAERDRSRRSRRVSSSASTSPGSSPSKGPHRPFGRAHRRTSILAPPGSTRCASFAPSSQGVGAAMIALHDLTVAARHCHRIVVLEGSNT